MCGRYSLFFDGGALEERFDAEFEGVYEPRYNAAPGQELPVITNDEPSVIAEQQWGLIPSWADDGSDGIINARAETVDEKPSFRSAFEERRCLVLADGFYEWAEPEAVDGGGGGDGGGAGGGGGKRPYRIALPDGEPFAMAGLWERWQPDSTQSGLDDFGGGGSVAGEHDEVVETFTIVTTEPNDAVEPVHDRMPVLLAPEEEAEWLGTPSEELLDPYDGELRVYPVSRAVNDPSNDSPEVVEEVEV